jgi:hypothetical protein
LRACVEQRHRDDGRPHEVSNCFGMAN